MYVIFHDDKTNGMRYYWVGKGLFTPVFEFAKKYPTWEAANAICERIKRWSCQFMSEEDYQEWLKEAA